MLNGKIVVGDMIESEAGTQRTSVLNLIAYLSQSSYFILDILEW